MATNVNYFLEVSMKTWKSVISAVLAGVMILSTIVTVGAANVTFTDTSSHWAKSQIEYLVSKEVLNGYKQSNGTYTFKPDGTVTRAEFVKMLDETFGLTSTAPINYNDVKTSDWFHTYFSKASAQGYLLNYGASVSPNGQLTREEATTLLVRYLGLLDAPKASSSQFTDYNSISSNFRDPVMIAVQAGLINGYKENNGTYTFRPKNTLTRAEALTILYRAAGAIYNTSAYSKDAGSADTNAVITRGGVTVSGLTLNGRVIVTEGASGANVTLTGCTIPGTLEIRGASDITLDKCTINEMTVDSISPEITVSLTGGSKVTSLILDSKIALAASTGSRVSTLTVNTGAKNVKVTGDGAIGALYAYAAGFTSTMVPDEFYIASGLTANFANKPYSGSSDDQASFLTIPFITEESGKYCLNVMPDDTGRIHYYFTNQYGAPSAAEFDAAYSAANYKSSFAVQNGKVYTEATFATNLVKNYDYVVIQLVTSSRAYAPVIIDNIPTSGTGFEIDPYFDGEDIVYKAAASGTVYYYYSEDGKDLTAAQFQNAYNKADKAMRGTGSVSSGRTGYIALNERYLANYPYVVVALATANGQYYKPVVVAAGSNGFDVEPKVTTIGTIEFKTNVTGTLYYYYSKSDELPSPQEFANNWPLERGKNSVSVTANKNGSLSYDEGTVDQYPYMVFCIKENKGDYMTPFILKVDYDTGFLVNPYVSGSDEVTFRTEYAGDVYWYMSRYSTAPTAESFMSEYNATTQARRGVVRSYSSASYSIFEFDNNYVGQYPYIYIMLVDLEGNHYQPVMLNVKETTDNGFATSPYCDLSTERVYFEPDAEGTLYYYFDRADGGYNLTPAEFWDMYNSIKLSDPQLIGSQLVDPKKDYIPFDTVDNNRYPGMVLMFVDNTGREYQPVYVSIRTGSSGSTASSGVTVMTVTSSKVTFVANDTEMISYYYVGTVNNPNAKANGGTIYASKGKTLEITHNGKYLFLYIEMEGYEPEIVDLTERYNRDEVVNDGSNKNGYGFRSQDLDFIGDQTVFTAVSDISGTVTMSISCMPGSETTVGVTAGVPFTISIGFDVNEYLSTSHGQLIGGSIYVQATSSEGDVYERLVVPFS